jgi:rhamnulose-1-phosphate aldolase
MLQAPYPELDDLLKIMGEAGKRLSEIEASEGSAGNISVCLRWPDEHYLNTHLLRWQPETIINLPEGIGFVPFRIPSSPELIEGTLESLRKHRIVIWAKHGVMARSDESVKRAVDRVEYAETAAKYEYINLCAGEIGEGLNVDEIHAICETFNVQQNIF